MFRTSPRHLIVLALGLGAAGWAASMPSGTAAQSGCQGEQMHAGSMHGGGRGAMADASHATRHAAMQARMAAHMGEGHAMGHGGAQGHEHAQGDPMGHGAMGGHGGMRHGAGPDQRLGERDGAPVTP